MFRSNPIVLLWRTAWAHAGRHRPIFAVYVGMFFVAQGISLSEPYVIGKLLNAVQVGATPESIKHEVSLYLLLYLLIQFSFWCLHGPARVLERMVAFHIKVHFKRDLFAKLTQLPLNWHREHHSGESIDRVNRASQSIHDFCGSSFELIYMVLKLFGSQIVLCWFMPAAGIVSFCSTMLAFLFVYLFDRKLYDQYRSLNQLENKIASAVQDYITNIVTVVMLRLESKVEHEVVRRMLRALGTFRSNVVMNEVKWFVTTMMVTLMIVAVMLGYTVSVTAGQGTLLAGTFFTLFEYLRRTGDSFYQFAGKYGALVRWAADIRSAGNIGDAHAALYAPTARLSLPRTWRKVEVRSLSFSYQQDSETYALRDVSVSLERGKAIAFVGESGSGKTTLLKLLRGLQPASDVTLVCDGEELGSSLAHLSHHTTLLPQDPEIFSDTVLFNIAFGLDSERDDVLRAAEMARFDPVLRRLPNGIDTHLNEKGVNLSGGEKQRLALARGIFFARNSDILLLDEPTSSVDPVNERMIYEKILARFREKCIVSTVHRLNLLPMFDEIYVFERGVLVERGTFSSLLERNGALAAMWRTYRVQEAITELEETDPVLN